MSTRLHCSFCSKSQDQVAKLVSGPSQVYICDECVQAAVRIMDAAPGRATRLVQALRRWLGGARSAPMQRAARA